MLFKLRTYLLNLFILLIMSLNSFAIAYAATDNTNPKVLIETNVGNITLELYPAKAPNTVKNFLRYVDDGFYNGTIFHRVIPNFMIQGGGFTPEMHKKITRKPIKNEANNGLHNSIGSVAMARTNNPHSATAQFFINVNKNSFLDFKEKTSRAYGYAVFAKVIQGMKIVNKIRTAKTATINGMKNVPTQPIVIKKIRRIN